MRVVIVLAFFLISLCQAASAQSCPVRRAPKPVDSGYDDGLDPSARQAITGTIVYHEVLRSWIGFRPDRIMCGQDEFELWMLDANGPFDDRRDIKNRIAIARGCKATIVGELRFTSNKDNVRAVELHGDAVTPDPACLLKPGFPSDSLLKPRPDVKKYDVNLVMHMAGEGSIDVRVRGHKRVLTPWNAYARYWVSADHYFTGLCGYGFVANGASSEPGGAGILDSNAMFDLSAFWGKAVTVKMTYTCVRVVPLGQ